jgi:hypothetical protein
MPRTEILRVGFDIDFSIGRLKDGASGLGMDVFFRGFDDADISAELVNIADRCRLRPDRVWQNCRRSKFQP